ncbi:HAD family hydrolase [Novipirellula artificiosorum]|uniref:Acid Phosphatase n=1 Tax=Novipirellula artificiosorum TaxID=2528016 RepID=A0A5C6DG01_9BACT|nr:Acid Phosphatase [Novipirellula artificiosorum]
MTLPKLIVFDLDFTLWDCAGTWCDCLARPFRVHAGRILDRGGRRVTFYKDVPSILDFCDRNEVAIVDNDADLDYRTAGIPYVLPGQADHHVKNSFSCESANSR